MSRLPATFAPAVMLAVVLGLALPGCEQSPSATGETQWGEPGNGLQAGLALKSVTAGAEPRVTLVFSVRNAGTQPVRFLKLSKYAGPGRGPPLEVVSQGQVCQYKNLTPPLAPPPPPAVADYISLAAGESDCVELCYALASWGLKAPFKAHVTFVYANKVSSTPAMPPFDKMVSPWPTVDGLWIGEAKSKPVSIEVGK